MRIERRLPFLSLCLSLAGLLFCLWVRFSGGKSLCLTDGCALFQDFSLAGISLWSAGSVFFGFILLLCLLRASSFARICAAAALCSDLLLMAVMSFTAPCVNCLIVGLLLALTFFSLLRETAPQKRARRSPLLLLWALLFIISAGGTLRDAADLWSPLPRPETSSVQVFFSPSCRACQTLTAQADTLRDAVWFPVAEDSRDIWLISAMTEELANGLPLHEAITRAHASLPSLADAPDLMALPEYRFGLLKPRMLLLQFRLWKNRSHVLAAGSDRLPFVEFKGLPSFLNGEAPSPAASSIPGIDLGIAGFCGGKNTPDSCKDDNSVKNSLPHETGLIDTSGMTQ